MTDFDQLAAKHGGTQAVNYDSLATAAQGGFQPAPADVGTVQEPGRLPFAQWAAPAAPYVLGGAGSFIGPEGAFAGGLVGKRLEEQLTNQPPNARNELMSGGGQLAMDLGGRALAGGLGLAGKGVGRIAENLKVGDIAKAETRARELTAAKDVTPSIQRELGAATAERGAAASRTTEALNRAQAAGKPGLSTDEIANSIIKQREDVLGHPLDPKHRISLVKDVRSRLADVAREHSVGTVQGKTNTFDLGEVQFLKRTFQNEAGSRASYAKAAQGIATNPTLDKDIASALKRHVESVVPEAPVLNQQTQGAIKQTQALARRKQMTPADLRIEGDKAAQVARAQIENPAPYSPVSFGGQHLVSFSPPTGAQGLQFAADVAQHPVAQTIANLAGRVPPAILAQLFNQPQQPETYPLIGANRP